MSSVGSLRLSTNPRSCLFHGSESTSSFLVTNAEVRSLGENPNSLKCYSAEGERRKVFDVLRGPSAMIGISARTVVPWPGADWTANLPPTISTRSVSQGAQSFVPLGQQDPLCPERFAVVMDFQSDNATELANVYFDMAGVRMPVDIGKSRLGDAIKHRSLDAVQFFDPGKGGETNVDAVRAAKSLMKDWRAGIKPRSSSTVGRNSRAKRWTVSPSAPPALRSRDFLPEILEINRVLHRQGGQMHVDPHQRLDDFIM